MRVVPGAKVGPDGCADDGSEGSAVGVVASSRPLTRAITRTTTSATTDSATTSPVGKGRGGRSGEARVPLDDVPADRGAGGASTGERCTATPGPAGVVTSDHRSPSHQRTWPDAPSGSGYQPGTGLPDSLTPEL